jgi:CRP/FNR family transcriptional regulator
MKAINNSMEIIDILENIDFFKGVSKKGRQALASICQPKTLKKNEVLFSEGDPGQSLFILVTGSVRIFKSAPNGRDTIIKVIQPGELFAEVILFEKETYPASAEAIKTSSVYVLPKRQFHALLDAQDFRNDFILMLMKKQRYLAEKLHALSAYDVEERFIRFLIEQYGKKNEYYMALSKKDLASSIGTIPETLSRLLARMQREGKISVKGKAVVIAKGFWQDWEMR